ncbi:MAG: mechanosensitive ion channel [Eubacteriales bacterium]|nr:mechanosensitive ion channel [Eubacteriales bacterium]
MDAISLIERKLPVVADVAIHIVIAFIIYLVGKKLIHCLIGFLKKSFDRSNMEGGVANFLLSIIKFALYFVMLIIICQFLGLETSSVVAILGSAGLTVGLALQGSLANFAGGVLILLMKPFVVGDYIIVGDKEGTVISIDIIYTKLQMVDNKTVIMPNGKLADSDIINVTNQHKRRIDIEVGVDYSENIQRVREVLEDIIQNQEKILREEPMDIVVGALNSSSVDMVVHVWVEKEDYWSVRWAMLEEIKQKFDENGIIIPFNQLDVTLKNEKKEHE